MLNRTPPAAVTRQLRKEVGFGCPVPNCGNPYLYWHHFDPPWGVRKHHNPEGMIALCGTHHPMADVGAYDKEQLREFKQSGRERAEPVRGRFEWMRRDLLVVGGGCFYYETPVILEYAGYRRVWFERDEDGYLLTNIRRLDSWDKVIENNFWTKKGAPEDIESPPSGKRLSIRYPQGESIKVEFFVLQSADDAVRRYRHILSTAGDESFFRNILAEWAIHFPFTSVEVNLESQQQGISLGPQRFRARSRMRPGGGLSASRGFFRQCGGAFRIAGPFQ